MRPLGCGFVAMFVVACSGVQEAVVSPVDVRVEDARTATVAHVEVDASSLGGKRYAIRPETSRIDVVTKSLIASFESRLRGFRGRLTLTEDRNDGGLAVDIDVASLENPSKTVTMILRYEFLEIDDFPTAHLEGRLHRQRGSLYAFEGILDLHGHRRRIAFEGELHRDAGNVRFTSTFLLNRHAFSIRQHDEWDFLNRDEVRVALDLHGTPETVRAEPVDEPPRGP